MSRLKSVVFDAILNERSCPIIEFYISFFIAHTFTFGAFVREQQTVLVLHFDGVSHGLSDLFLVNDGQCVEVELVDRVGVSGPGRGPREAAGSPREGR